MARNRKWLARKQCGTKKSYPTREAAEMALTVIRLTMMKKSYQYLQPYTCGFCGSFHLGRHHRKTMPWRDYAHHTAVEVPPSVC